MKEKTDITPLGLERQITSTWLCVALKVLGVPQESLYFWCDFKPVQERLKLNERWQLFTGVEAVHYKGNEAQEIVSAFTVAELGILLPESIELGEEYRMYHNKSKDKREIGLVSMASQALLHVELEEKEADARAKMLAYLLKNDLIKL